MVTDDEMAGCEVTERCALCERAAPLTRHHLIPRTLHRKPRYRKRLGRDLMQMAILWVCRPCHSHLHRTLSERELADHYASREALLSHPDIRAFAEWLATKPDGFVPKRQARRRRS